MSHPLIRAFEVVVVVVGGGGGGRTQDTQILSSALTSFEMLQSQAFGSSIRPLQIN